MSDDKHLIASALKACKEMRARTGDAVSAGEAYDRLFELVTPATTPDALNARWLMDLVFSAGTTGRMDSETRARLYTWLADQLESAT